MLLWGIPWSANPEKTVSMRLSPIPNPLGIERKRSEITAINIGSRALVHQVCHRVMQYLHLVFHGGQLQLVGLMGIVPALDIAMVLGDVAVELPVFRGHRPQRAGQGIGTPDSLFDLWQPPSSRWPSRAPISMRG